MQVDPSGLILSARKQRDARDLREIDFAYVDPVSNEFNTAIRDLDDLRFDLTDGTERFDLRFHVSEAIRSTTPFWVRHYEGRIGKRLVPVGFGHGHHMLVHLAEDGSFVGSFDSLLWELGPSLEEVLTNITRTGLPEVE